MRYDQMVEDALRSVVRRSLTIAAEQGLPGEHHFYITFKTEHPQVDIPEELSKRYPSEMTIVLQNQFWDLEVYSDRFEVKLSFSGVPHQLKIAFGSVIAFADPSVRFGLQFDVSDGSGSEEVGEDKVVAPSAPKKKVEKTGPARSEKETAEDAAKKVVTLDSFRKK
ncbi:MAG: ClpXP protease specificity-enhancing factor SspB [Pseudomonadota bacterium]